MSDNANCFKCKYRGDVPGSCHSSCHHPAFESTWGDKSRSLMAQFIPGFRVTSNECRVVGHPQGVRGGWFQHPFNFDPVWLVSCTGFTPKEDEPKEAEDK